MRGLLIFYDYFTPAYKAGGPIRSLENLIHLLKGHFNIFVITTNQDHGGETLEVVADEWIKRSDKVFVIHLSPENRTFINVKKLVSKIEFDGIYINGIFSPFTTIIPLKLGKRLNVPIWIAPRGMLQRGALSIKPLKKKVYLFLLKFFLLRRNQVNWHATDEQEEQDILRFTGKMASIKVVGNIPSYDSTFLPVVKEMDCLKLVTISLIAPKKNHVFFLNVLKEIDTTHSVIYDIYGPVSDEEHLRSLQHLAKQLSSNIKVAFKPSVKPREVNEILKSYHYFVLPTLGENFGHAIFEAFNVGLPVLISDQTPWKNLAGKSAGWDLALNEKTWIKTMNEVINQGVEDYHTLQAGARKVAEDYISSENLRENYLTMFQTSNL
ncbi:MAG: glycosyltransferase [Cyclobacteriaceae bacterium]